MQEILSSTSRPSIVTSCDPGQSRMPLSPSITTISTLSSYHTDPISPGAAHDSSTWLDTSHRGERMMHQVLRTPPSAYHRSQTASWVERASLTHTARASLQQLRRLPPIPLTSAETNIEQGTRIGSTEDLERGQSVSWGGGFYQGDTSITSPEDARSDQGSTRPPTYHSRDPVCTHQG